MTEPDWKLPNSILRRLDLARQERQKIVLVTGVFDILHPEHQKFLTKAKAEGDLLVVGLESDVRVRALKGPGRPVNSATIRQANLAKLMLADEIFILPNQFKTPLEHEKLIKLIGPAVLAVSSHTAHLSEKAAILQKLGGQVIVVLKHNPTVSSTLLIKKSA